MPSQDWTIAEQDQLIADALERDEPRLRSFIGKRVFDSGDAEDVLQDVFYELIQTYRLMKPVEQVTAWLYRVARNRITDLFRRSKPESLSTGYGDSDTDTLLDLLPSEDAGPDAIYARTLLFEALDEAIDELPEEQREVFIAHEMLAEALRSLQRRRALPSIRCSHASATPSCISGDGCSRSTTTLVPSKEEPTMKQYRIFKALKFVVLILLATAVFGEVVMHLWNWLMPEIFGLRTLNFAQALGLLILTKLLFGGFHRHGGGGGRRWKRDMEERFSKMTPEERDRFRSGMRGRWGCRPTRNQGSEPRPEQASA